MNSVWPVPGWTLVTLRWRWDFFDVPCSALTLQYGTNSYAPWGRVKTYCLIKIIHLILMHQQTQTTVSWKCVYDHCWMTHVCSVTSLMLVWWCSSSCFCFPPAADVPLAFWRQRVWLDSVQAGALPAKSLCGHHRPQPVRPQRGQVSAVTLRTHAALSRIISLN